MSKANSLESVAGRFFGTDHPFCAGVDLFATQRQLFGGFPFKRPTQDVSHAKLLHT